MTNALALVASAKPQEEDGILRNLDELDDSAIREVVASEFKCMICLQVMKKTMTVKRSELRSSASTLIETDPQPTRQPTSGRLWLSRKAREEEVTVTSPTNRKREQPRHRHRHRHRLRKESKKKKKQKKYPFFFFFSSSSSLSERNERKESDE